MSLSRSSSGSTTPSEAAFVTAVANIANRSPEATYALINNAIAKWGAAKTQRLVSKAIKRQQLVNTARRRFGAARRAVSLPVVAAGRRLGQGAAWTAKKARGVSQRVRGVSQRASAAFTRGRLDRAARRGLGYAKRANNAQWLLGNRRSPVQGIVNTQMRNKMRQQLQRNINRYKKHQQKVNRLQRQYMYKKTRLPARGPRPVPVRAAYNPSALWFNNNTAAVSAMPSRSVANNRSWLRKRYNTARQWWQRRA